MLGPGGGGGPIRLVGIGGLGYSGTPGDAPPGFGELTAARAPGLRLAMSACSWAFWNVVGPAGAPSEADTADGAATGGTGVVAGGKGGVVVVCLLATKIPSQTACSRLAGRQ